MHRRDVGSRLIDCNNVTGDVIRLHPKSDELAKLINPIYETNAGKAKAAIVRIHDGKKPRTSKIPRPRQASNQAQ